MAADAGPAPVRVVIVDDTADIRSLVRVVLERAGFEVVGEAADGAEAIEVAEEARPDLVILDLAMPTLDGLQALPRIRQRLPGVKVVVLSGFEASQMRAEAEGVGADAYVEKGATAEQLIDTVTGVMGHSTSPPTAPPPRLDEQAMSALIHELGAPITVIEGFIDLLGGPMTDLDDETFHRAVDAIRRNAAQLRGVLTAFADARRIDVDALDLRRASTDVSLLLAEVCESLRTIVGKHEITLDAAPGIRAEVDAVRVQQIVINLVQNAAKFSDPGTPIEVGAASTGGTLRIAVTDHGAGVPADERGRIFGKFTRLNRDKPGTGLGLYICRGIARAHGGDLVLEEAGDGGCRFALTLPIGSPA